MAPKTRTLPSVPFAHALKNLMAILLTKRRARDKAIATPRGTAAMCAPLLIIPVHILDYVDHGDKDGEDEGAHDEAYQAEELDPPEDAEKYGEERHPEPASYDERPEHVIDHAYPEYAHEEEDEGMEDESLHEKKEYRRYPDDGGA